MRYMLYNVIDTFFVVYMWMLILRIVGSWFPDIQDRPFFRFLRYYTDPYLDFFRRFIPPLGMIDFSPIIAFFALQLIEYIVKGLMFR